MENLKIENLMNTLDEQTFEHPEIQTKFNYLKAFYGKAYNKFIECIENDGVRDDRIVFVNMMNMLFESLVVMDQIYKESIVVDVAFNEYLQREEETLKRIRDKFTEEV